MFWLFTRVTNFAYLRYDRMSKDLQAVADRWENRVLGEVREVTAEARKLEGEARVKYVTDYSVMMAQTLFDLWKADGRIFAGEVHRRQCEGARPNPANSRITATAAISRAKYSSRVTTRSGSAPWRPTTARR